MRISPKMGRNNSEYGMDWRILYEFYLWENKIQSMQRYMNICKGNLYLFL